MSSRQKAKPRAASHSPRAMSLAEPPVVLAVRDHLEDRRERCVRLVGAAARGSHRFADSSSPSLDGDPDVEQGADLVPRLARGPADLGIDRLGGHHDKDRSGAAEPRGADRGVRRCAS